MITTAYIHLWEKRIGAVAWDPTTGIGTFEYSPSYVKNGWDVSPIEMPISAGTNRIFSFPQNRESSTFRGLPGLLADMLPDRYGNALINTWLTSRGRASNSLNPVEMLCFIGTRGIGALEIEPAYEPVAATASKIEISSLIAIADTILKERNNFKTNLSKEEEKALLSILKIGTSAGGARAKALIAYNPKTQEVRSGQTLAPKGYEHWLIKFDGVADSQLGSTKGYGRVEMAYHLMAVQAGITMTACRLLEEHDRAHFMTRRFDRGADNTKLHVQSFCALRHFDFNEVGLYSYEQLFETMRMIGLPYPDAEQLYRRMVFNVLARNCDDHTKNFSFIMDREGNWRLSPAYDVCHAYRPGSQWVSQQSLSINGKRQEISLDDYEQVAKAMNIKKWKDIVAAVSDAVRQWQRVADSVGVDKKLRNAIQKTLLVPHK